MENNKRDRLKKVLKAISDESEKREILSLDADIELQRLNEAITSLKETTNQNQQHVVALAKQFGEIITVFDKYRSQMPKMSQAMSDGLVKLNENLVSKLSEVGVTISTSYEKNKPFNAAGVYKDMINQLATIDKSINNKPVPVWNWPQYAAVNVRDKNFANVDPSQSYQHNSTTPSLPYGTALSYDSSGTIKVVSSANPLPVTASVTINSVSQAGLKVDLSKLSGGTSLLSGIRVNQTSSYDASIVDANNTTTATLAGNASFTGTGTDVLNYSFINILLYSDVSSASNGVKLEFSNDNTNWDDASLFTFSAGGTPPNAGQTFGASPRGRYFRIVYTNGSSAQSAFRLTTVLKKNVSIGDQMTMTLVPNSTNHALLTKSSIIGLTTAGGSSFVDVKVNPSGSLTVAIDSTTIAGLKVLVTTNAVGIKTNLTQVSTPILAGTRVFINNPSTAAVPANITAVTTPAFAGTKVLVTTNAVGLKVQGTDTLGTSGPTALTVQGIPSGTTLNSSTAPVVVMGMRNSAGNAFYAQGVSDNADGYAVSANGNIIRVMAQGALFNGSTYDRARGISGAALITTNAVGIKVNIAQSSATITTLITTNSVGVKVNVAQATTSVLAGTRVFINNTSSSAVPINITAATTSTLAGLKVDHQKVAGSTVATVAAGVQKVGVADSGGTAITSTGAALDINLKTSSITLNTLVTTNAVGLKVNVTQATTSVLAGTRVFINNTSSSAIPVNLTSATTSVLAGTKILSEGRAQNAEATATTNGSTVASAHDLVGKQIILPYANPENFINGSTKITTTSSTQIIAGVASTRLYITSIIASNTSSSVSTYLKLQDGSGGAVLAYIPLPSNGGAVIPLPTPVKTTAGNGLFVQMFNALTTAFITGVGYKGV